MNGTSVSAPKGRNTIAQGNALGREPITGSVALKGRNRSPAEPGFHPFRASSLVPTRFPRVLPWAIVLRPFGAEGRAADPLRFRSGLSLLEAVVSTVLVGVLLIAALRTVGASVFMQCQSAERAAGQMLADGLMAEILAKCYKSPGASPIFGRESGESSASKANYNDVDDYQGWSESPPQFADGSTMPDLADWQRSVGVDWIDSSDLSRTQWWDTGAKRITVTVRHNNVVIATRVAIRGEAP